MSSEIRKVVIRIVIAAVVLIGVIVVAGATYTVPQYEQAVVLEFGKPVGDEAITEPGLHFKLPFIQEVRLYEKRILEWDGEPNQIPTKGGEFIRVDTMARWRIVDALKFLQSVRDVRGAITRLDDILDSVVRDQISSTELVEVVRSSDWEISERELQRAVAAGEKEAQLTQDVEVGREQIEANCLEEASKSMGQYGVELIDFRIKRLNYSADVQKQVFERMKSERQRIAEQFRSEGEGEASQIGGETQRMLSEIRSGAQREAEEVRGQGDAEAARIYSEAFGADAEFYAFVRSLESYQSTLGEGTVLILGSDADYLRYLKGAGEPAK